MPLVQPSNRREKLCIFGPPKVGKSTAWLSIAKLAAETGDTRKFFAIDTDDALGVILDAPQYKNVDVRLHEAQSYEEVRRASDAVFDEAEAGDFVVIDMASVIWEWSQVYTRKLVTEQATKEESLEAAWKAGKKGWELYGQDLDQGGWAVAREKYFGVMDPWLIRSKAHVIIVAQERNIPPAPTNPTKKDPDKGNRTEFGEWMPAGQKGLGYSVRSLLRLQRLQRGRLMTTFGDREREELKQEEYSNFALTYLCKVAGWKIEK